MKYSVKVGDRTYEVEIENIYTRPVIVRVEGEQFEVTPENGIRLDGEKEAGGLSPLAAPDLSDPSRSPAASAASSPLVSGKTIVSPLPGTLTEVFIRKGDKVESGQVILVIEAMKMKNSIRSVRPGTVAEVLVSAGQTVAHKQALVEFTE